MGVSGLAVMLDQRAHPKLAVCQDLDGFAEGEVAGFLEKVEHVALGITAEAVVELLLGIDYQRGLFVVVPGTNRRVVAPNLGQLDAVGAHDFAEIYLGLESFDVLA